MKPYTKVASHEASKEEADHVLLLYSGGLDTSIMLKWIHDQYEAEVTALTIDIGQKGDFKAIKQKAIDLGVKEAILIDAKEKFANTFISKGIKANVSYQGDYHLFCPMGRAIISEIAVKIAQEKGIKVIAHGCTGKGNDQVRFESYITILDPKLKTIAPVREKSMGRDEELAYAKKHNIPVPHSVNKPYSYDSNLWGCSAEGGEIEELDQSPPLNKILKICKTPEEAKDSPETIKLYFEKGIPTKLNKKSLPLTKLITKLTEIGAEHGIGIVPMIEDRLVGLKIRDIYEQPAAAIIIEAHKNLEKLVSTKAENDFKHLVDQKWSDLCYCSQWYNPLMQSLNAFIDKMNEKVTGEVTLKLYKGSVTTVALDSSFSLIDKNLATFMKNDLFNQNASAGFIEIHSLSQKIAVKVAENNKMESAKPDLRF